jgi:DNA-binding NarL/FixJ family response regulator
VIVGEPRPLMRVALSRCLSEHGFTVSGEAVDAAGLINLGLTERPDLCLLAGDLPGGAVTAIVAIRSTLPDAGIVVVVERESVGEALELVRVGARGYISKDIGYDALPRVLRGLQRGEAAMSRALMGRLLTRMEGLEDHGTVIGADDKPVPLTGREVEVLQMLSRGSSTADIARRLSISPITARRHCAEIRRKLGAADRAAVVALAARQVLPE